MKTLGVTGGTLEVDENVTGPDNVLNGNCPLIRRSFVLDVREKWLRAEIELALLLELGGRLEARAQLRESCNDG
jgi:hypothetical protein